MVAKYQNFKKFKITETDEKYLNLLRQTFIELVINLDAFIKKI